MLIRIGRFDQAQGVGPHRRLGGDTGNGDYTIEDMPAGVYSIAADGSGDVHEIWSGPDVADRQTAAGDREAVE